ncbi:transcriptional regulator, GntR family [Nocardioides terrae]|uniref:Transcriptional regulator, GntR family n=1 Tax=Nocardioides terrae TaxID=574651 RepID=A0A1I1JNF8_9ACTN|nr:FCD domain-containing protein [Nocardioides terrae]SFC50127.1 transcriptional regulator, GntR family [Nocardioides terrae]
MTPSPEPSAAAASATLPVTLLSPVRGHHAFEACVEQLARAIRLGVYPLGSTLPPERELSTQLGVSRATLREAMAALRQAGLVQTTRGRGGGTVVILKPPTPSARAAARTTPEQRSDWLDALAFRRVIEPGAAAMLAEAGLDDTARAQLLAAHDEVAAASKPAHYRQSDSRFHLTIAALTGSHRVIESVTSVQATLHEMLLAIPQLETNIAHSDDQHTAVVRAILAKRPDPARRAMEQHCDDTAALLRGLLA